MKPELVYLIGYLARTKYKDSIAPRRAIASELKDELIAEGYSSEDDRFLAVINAYPITEEK